MKHAEKMAALQERRSELVDDIERIQAELSERNRERNGQRVSPEQYHKWRKRTLHRLTRLQRDLRSVNVDLRIHRRSESIEDRVNLRHVLNGLHVALKKPTDKERLDGVRLVAQRIQEHLDG